MINIVFGLLQSVELKKIYLSFVRKVIDIIINFNLKWT